MTSPTNALSDNYPHTDDCKCVGPFIDFDCLGLKEGMTVAFKGLGDAELWTDTTISKIEKDKATGVVTILTASAEEDSAPDVTPLSVRMLEAADTLEAASKLYDYIPNAYWRPMELRRESLHVADEEAGE